MNTFCGFVISGSYSTNFKFGYFFYWIINMGGTSYLLVEDLGMAPMLLILIFSSMMVSRDRDATRDDQFSGYLFAVDFNCFFKNFLCDELQKTRWTVDNKADTAPKDQDGYYLFVFDTIHSSLSCSYRCWFLNLEVQDFSMHSVFSGWTATEDEFYWRSEAFSLGNLWLSWLYHQCSGEKIPCFAVLFHFLSS